MRIALGLALSLFATPGCGSSIGDAGGVDAGANVDATIAIDAVSADAPPPRAPEVYPTDTTPLDDEIAATLPRAAVIMYGTNGIQLGNIDQYGTNLLTLADLLMARRVVPLFTTIMPRDDSASAVSSVSARTGVCQASVWRRLLDLAGQLGRVANRLLPHQAVDDTGVGDAVTDGENRVVVAVGKQRLGEEPIGRRPARVQRGRHVSIAAVRQRIGKGKHGAAQIG